MPDKTPTIESQPKPSSPHLVRQIGLGSGIAVVIGSMIGSGIFKSPSDIAVQLPGPLPMLAVWVVGGLFALCGALTLSEVGGAFPYSGGLYVFIREAYGRLPAFLFGWSNLLSSPTSIGAVAIVFSQYTLRLAGLRPGSPGFDIGSTILAVSAIVVVTVANVCGVRFGTVIQNLTTLAKTGGLATLIILALAIGLPRAGGHFVPALPTGSFSVPLFGLALVSVLFAYDGWMNASYVGGEILDPRKNVPRAILFGTMIVIAVYLLANVAYVSVFSVHEIGKSPIIAADSMAKLVGASGATFIIATVMISTFGTLNGGVLTSPRILFAMAEDRLFFAPLARVHSRFNTPYVAVVLSGALGILYVLIATALSGAKAFSALVNATVIANIPFYALAVGSVFIFRRREKNRKQQAVNGEADPNRLDDSLLDPVERGHLETHPHPYTPPVHTPLYPWPPLLFVASTLFLVGNALLKADSRLPTLAILGMVAAGAPIYYATIGRSGGHNA